MSSYLIWQVTWEALHTICVRFTTCRSHAADMVAMALAAGAVWVSVRVYAEGELPDYGRLRG